METSDTAGPRAGDRRFNWMRPRTLRRSTISCCRSAAFSASSRLVDLNNEAKSLNKKHSSATIVADV
jgi:hypothetical protein